MNRYIIIILLSLLSPVVAEAQNYELMDSVKVYFKQGQRQYNPDYMDNDASMSRFLKAVGKAGSDSVIYRIGVKGYASPEGSNAANERLSRLRCNTIFDYLTGVGAVDPLLIEISPGGVAWDELRKMVAADAAVPYQAEVLKVLDDTPLWVFDSQNRVVGGRKKSLMDLRGGVPYRWMYERFFPVLRNGVAITLFLKNDNVVAGIDSVDLAGALPSAEDADIAVADVVAAEEPVEVMAETEVADTSRHDVERISAEPFHRFALKSNLVYDALLMPSLEFEWRINDRWSVAFEYDIAWWKNEPKHKYYQVMVFSPEVKRWFNTRRPWRGMYVGAFGGGGKYDLENGNRGYKGEGGFVGLSFGYMFPIARDWSFEAAVGAGYMYTRYKEYLPFEGHYVYQRTSRTNYFGPLKAKFALVWRFNDINKRKK